MFLEGFLQRELLTAITILHAKSRFAVRQIRITRVSIANFTTEHRTDKVSQFDNSWSSKQRTSMFRVCRENTRYETRRGEHAIHNPPLVNVRLEFGVFVVPFRNSVPVRLMRNGFLAFLRKRASVRTAKCGVAAHKMSQARAVRRTDCCRVRYKRKTRRAKHVITWLNVL